MILTEGLEPGDDDANDYAARTLAHAFWHGGREIAATNVESGFQSRYFAADRGGIKA